MTHMMRMGKSPPSTSTHTHTYTGYSFQGLFLNSKSDIELLF